MSLQELLKEHQKKIDAYAAAKAKTAKEKSAKKQNPIKVVEVVLILSTPIWRVILNSIVRLSERSPEPSRSSKTAKGSFSVPSTLFSRRTTRCVRKEKGIVQALTACVTGNVGLGYFCLRVRPAGLLRDGS